MHTSLPNSTKSDLEPYLPCIYQQTHVLLAIQVHYVVSICDRDEDVLFGSIAESRKTRSIFLHTLNLRHDTQ